MKKYLAVVAAVALVALAAPVFAATNPFMDVPLNHWAYDAIGQLAAQGILSGYPDGTYKGKQPTTRYEMASALARALAYVDMTKADKQDVEMLKKLVVEFKDELDALGVRVDQIDGRLGKIEERLGGWKLSGNMRVDLYDVDDGTDAGSSGTAMPRARLEIQRWFGEDEGIHLYIRLTDGEYRYGPAGTALTSATGSTTRINSVTFNKFYVEIPVWWDSVLTAGRFAWDMEGAYYLNLSSSMGWQHDSWLTDRTVDGLGFRKSFGMGTFSAYVAHPYVGWHKPTGTDNYGAWELFAMGQLQFTEQIGFDLGAQYFLGDDTSKITVENSTFEFDSMLTAFAGIRFNFNDSISLKGLYYYQDVNTEVDGIEVDRDSTSAFRVAIDVNQDLLKFTSLWLEYDSLEAGFVMPNPGALVLGGTDVYSVGRDYGFSPAIQPYDQSIWRVGAKQDWNEKWTTLAYVANHTFDNTEYGDADVMQWALGVVYKYNPSVHFGLIYSKYDADDETLAISGLSKDPSIIRFRTWVAF